jgi:iron complex outermembrane receptor protein
MVAGSLLLGGGFSLMPLSAAVAEELGIIRVESTTIDDRFENKRAVPSNIGVIGGDEVDAAHTQNIQQLLQGVPGITTEVQSGDSIKLHIRGVENQVYMGEKPGVAVVIDGVPVFERTGRVNIDLDNIESIKVIKGGASYLFGDDALAGAVVITTKRGAANAGIKLGAEAGSYGYTKGLARVGTAGERFNGHVQVSHREIDGYHDDSASKADYLNGKLQYYVDDFSDLTFGFEHADREKNSHGSVSGVSAAEEDPKSTDPAYNDYANRFDVKLDKLFLTYSRDIGESSNLMLNTYQFKDKTQFLSNPLDADPEAYSYDNDYLQIQRGVKAEYRSGGESLAWLLATDLRANRYDNDVTYLDCSEAWGPCSVGGRYDDNTTDEQVKALYGELKFRPADKLVMTLNGRYDVIDLDYSDDLDSSLDDDKQFKVGSWRLGGNYALGSNLDLYANASTGFRAPTVSQLFVGTGSPTMRTEANPDLRPEHALNTEMGVRSRHNWFGVPMEMDLAVFQIERKDHIQSTAGQYTTASDNIYDNVGDMRSRGLELALSSDPQRKLSFDLAYTYLLSEYIRYDSFYLQTYNPAYDPTCSPYVPPFTCEPKYNATLYDNSGNEVPRVPHHHLNLTLHAMPKAHWLVSLEMDATSSYYADEINQEQIGGHTTFNLLLNYDREWRDSDWEFFARIDNLFDRNYYNTVRGHGDQNDDGLYDQEDLSIVVNEGRSYTAGLSVKF